MVRHTNLLATPTSFVGRHEELRALAELVALEHVVSVLGPPGAGKTRLVRRLAEQGLADKRDRLPRWFVDLRDATTLLDVCHQLGVALGIPLTARGAAEAVVEHLGRALAGRGAMLVILDNFEQIVPLAAASLGHWRAAAPEVKWLVTSRERLRLPGEVLFDLGPLGRRDAMTLLIERASAARSDFDEDAATLEQLVERLDRLPLAIELCAARLRILPPRQLLEEGFAVLGTGVNPGAARADTLWDAIEASWRLLPPWERAALAQCAYFRGGFDLAAARAVIELPAEAGRIEDCLQSLRDKSLLEVVPRGARARFTLLAAIREFALAKLSSQERAAIARRHRAHHLALASRLSEEIEATSSLAARDALLAELENLALIHREALEAGDAAGVTAALEAAVGLNPLLQVRGPTHLRHRLLDQALTARAAVAGDYDSALVAVALAGRAHCHQLMGAGEAALADYSSALQVAEESSNPVVTGRIKSRLGATLFEQGRLQEALPLVEAALPDHRAGGDLGWEGTSVCNLGTILLSMGRLDVAREHLERARRLHRRAGDLRREAIDLNNLASIDEMQGDTATARRHYESALALEREADDPAFEAGILTSLVMLDMEEGHHERAGERLGVALRLARDVGHRYIEGILLTCRGQHEELLGDASGALASYEAALDVLGGTSPGMLGPVLYASLASLAAARGSRDATERFLARAEETARDQPEDLALVVRLTRAAVAPERDEDREPVLEAARARLEQRPSVYLRLAFRRLEAVRARDAASRSGRVLQVGREAAWFRWSDGERVSLGRRRALRAVLQALVEHHARAGVEVLDVQALVERGWPGERISPEAAQSRLHNALSTLRRLGLRDALERHDAGYRLAPDIVIPPT